METTTEVPPFFICPISLQVMKDPVTISTGMTFDRHSIQKWLSHYNKSTCPLTNQPLSDPRLTPNSNLRRLIHSWRSSHTSPPKPGLQQAGQMPMPEPLINLNDLIRDLNQPHQPHLQLKSLKSIKSLIQQSGGHRSCMEDSRLASLVAYLISETKPERTSQPSEESVITHEAMSVFYLLRPSEDTVKKLAQEKNGQLISSLCSILIQHASLQARIQAALILKSIFRVVDGIFKDDLKFEFFECMAEILKDQSSVRASMTVLSILMEVLPSGGRNRGKAVDAGTVPVIVELLVESGERRACEIMMTVLDQLCQGEAGRAALVAHPAGVAVVSSKLLRISQVVNERAVNVLLSVLRFCKRSGVAEEVVEVGGVAKLCMVVQTVRGGKTKEKAREILGLHLRTLKNSACFPSISFVV